MSKSLNKILSQIQVELKAEKSKYNSFGKYNYRSAEDILEALKPHLTKHNVTVRIVEDIVGYDPLTMIRCNAVISDGEDEISAVAIVAVDMEQKGMQMAQRFGATSSYGKKYALGNLFLIDDTRDADATNTHGKGVSQVKKLKMTADAVKKAMEYVRSGGSYDDIEKKYAVTAAQKKKILGA